MDDLNDKIKNLAEHAFGFPPERIENLAGAGSSRLYMRLFMPAQAVESGSPASCIATFGADAAENATFCRLSRALADSGACYRLPGIYAESEDGSCYLQEDFGDLSLYDLILEARDGKVGSQDLRKAVEICLQGLAEMQTNPADVIEKNVGFPEFSEELAMWDLNYFKYCFLKPAGICFDESALESDFRHLGESVARYDRRLRGFMYRDFQSRNIMLSAGNGGCPGFIDFQGGRVGPMVYDVVSFLWQARAGFDHDFRAEMTDYYASLIADRRGVDKQIVVDNVKLFKLLRTLQVLGAYGFRGLIEHKAQFVETIPAAVDNLKECLDDGSLDAYPELKMCCESITVDSRWKRDETLRNGLTIEVFSFSYKKGYPHDYSGNGGGFMFDCRGLHNPGRYEEYKSLTGRDPEVMEFLEKRGEVQPFLAAVYQMVDHSAETYLRRGFSNLQIGFGCTGGQHRSVYCAEHTARHLAAEFPAARVILRHREQRIEEIFNQTSIQ